MATNVDEESGSKKCTSDDHSDSRDIETDSSRANLLFTLSVLYDLACTAYSFYLVWLLAYLKENRNYWFLSFLVAYIPLVLLAKLLSLPVKPRSALWVTVTMSLFIINVMVCFTMLTRTAYYHRQPDQFIGPRFIIVSLQGSIILVSLGFVLKRECQMKLVFEDKDVLNRAVLDFVDIFNMIEILSATECVGVGSLLSEGSSTEMAIQAFCTLSFLILLADCTDDRRPDQENNRRRRLVFCVFYFSIMIQNFPFLIIRIIVWAQYKLYSLGFLVKNVFAIVISFIQLYKHFGSKFRPAFFPWQHNLRQNLIPRVVGSGSDLLSQ